MAPTFTVNNWTVTTLGAETAAPVVNVVGTTGTVALAPSFVDSAPVAYVFKDNLPGDRVSNDLRFDLDLKMHNGSDFRFDAMTVDTLTMPPVTIVEGAAHPTLAHFHPTSQNPAPPLVFTQTGYGTGTNVLTKDSVNVANHVYLTNNPIGPNQDASWGSSKVHHWDGQFALITTPVTQGDAGGLLAGLNGGQHVTWKAMWHAQADGESFTGAESEDLAYGQGGDNLMSGGYGRDGLVGGEGNDTLNGNQDDDFLWGQAGNDSLNGDVGRDWMDGGAGDDTLDGSYGPDWMAGGDGDDFYYVDDPGDVIEEFMQSGYERVVSSTEYYGMTSWVDEVTLTHSAGVDVSGNEINNVINGNGFNNHFWSLSGNDKLHGEDGEDWLEGGIGDDTLKGGAGNDTLDGGEGSDTLEGGHGHDRLIAGWGKDHLTGNDDADQFVFTWVDDIGKGADGDTIADFCREQGDKIDLKGIDAITESLEIDTFTFIGTASFGGVAGQLRCSDGTLQGDVTGDGIADFDLHLIGTSTLMASDLIL